MKFSTDKILIPFFLLFIVLTIAVRNHFFFWDTIQLGSYHGQWFYENQFSDLILPSFIDSGHFPGLGIYLAACWTLFGKSLAVSHFAMLPFLFGVVWLIYHIANHYTDQKKALFLLLLLIADPCYMGQSVLVTPDICLLFFFLLGLYAILKDKNTLISLAALGLAISSLRGMMVVVILFLFRVIFFSKKDVKSLFITMLPFVPSGLFGLAFLGYHYQQTGWAGYHEDSPWSPAFEKVSFKGFLYNIALLGWRILDFGRVFLIVAILILFYRNGLSAWKESIQFRQLVGLLILLVILLTPSLLIHKELLGHRYILPIYISLSLLVFYLISTYVHRFRLWFSVIIIGLFLGNFWVYPKGISMGWDSTLAHLPYYNLRNKMIDFIDEKEIPITSIGTGFPNRSGLKYSDLIDRDVSFPMKDLEHQDYIFYSNIFNEFTDSEIAELEKEWEVLQSYEQMRVCVILYKKR